MVYVSQPLDTVKVKMQTFPELYKGMVSCFMTTLKRDGVVRGLYAGNELNCAAASRILINLLLNHTFFAQIGTVPAIVANVAENSVLFAGKINANLKNLIISLKNRHFDTVHIEQIHTLKKVIKIKRNKFEI